MYLKNAMVAMIFVILAGCSVHSPLNIKSKTELRNVTGAGYPPHSRRIFVTRSSLPETVQYEVLGIVEVGKVWYGSTDEVLQSIADGAREKGADGVVEVKTWFQVSGWSWAAPHGSGIAVKIINPVDFDWSALEGSWKEPVSADVIQALNNEYLKLAATNGESGHEISEKADSSEVANIIALRQQLKKAEITVLLKQLEFDNAVLFEKSAKEIYKKGVTGEKDLDFLAEIIWQNSNKRDRKTVNGLCYLCKVFIKSKNPRYKTFFEQIRNEGKTRKLRKYAIKTLRYLSPCIVEQFVPGNGKRSVSL